MLDSNLLEPACDRERLAERERVNHNLGLGFKPMPNPSRAQAANLDDAGHMMGCVAHLADDAGLDAVERACEDHRSGLPDDHDDHRGNPQPDDRIGDRKSRLHRDGAAHDGEAGQAVGTRMITIGDQRGAVDFVFHPDSHKRDRLVGEETNDACGGRRPGIATACTSISRWTAS